MGRQAPRSEQAARPTRQRLRGQAAEPKPTGLEAVKQYRQAIRAFADIDNLAVWYARIEAESVLEEPCEELKRSSVKRTEKVIAKARTSDSMFALRVD